MKITYTGIKQELSPRFQQKLDARFSKLSKLLEKRGEVEAHVVVTAVRHLHKAEITVPFYEHKLVGVASDADVFTAIHESLAKLETQALKNRGKWREKHRRQDELAGKEAKAAKAAPQRTPEDAKASSAPVNVFKVNHHEQRKPMTLDEAMLEMEEDRDYLVYRDADKDNITVLVRRRDGHFDLIES